MYKYKWNKRINAGKKVIHLTYSCFSSLTIVVNFLISIHLFWHLSKAQDEHVNITIQPSLKPELSIKVRIKEKRKQEVGNLDLYSDEKRRNSRYFTREWVWRGLKWIYVLSILRFICCWLNMQIRFSFVFASFVSSLEEQMLTLWIVYITESRNSLVRKSFA